MAFITSSGCSCTDLSTSGSDIHLRLATPLLAGTATESIVPSELKISGDDGIAIGRMGDLTAFALVQRRDGALRQQARRAYTAILRQLGQLRILRIWNHIPAINTHCDGIENYQAFCVGRAEAFDTHLTESGKPIEYPAGSALGINDDSLVIFGIGYDPMVPARFFENPNQIPAHQYPPKYGPRAPAFSRASISINTEDHARSVVYISGTSSVVGSETQHPFDLSGQLSTTRDILDTLVGTIESEATLTQPLEQSFAAAEFRLYLRESKDTTLATEWLKNNFPLSNANWRVVKADICRRELLAEVEISIHPKVDLHA